MYDKVEFYDAICPFLDRPPVITDYSSLVILVSHDADFHSVTCSIYLVIYLNSVSRCRQLVEGTFLLSYSFRDTLVTFFIHSLIH